MDPPLYVLFALSPCVFGAQLNGIQLAFFVVVVAAVVL